MSGTLRVVFDTNVLVSASLRASSRPSLAVRLTQRRGALLVSDGTLVELEEVLQRPKFDRYVSAQRRGLFFSTIQEEGLWVEVKETIRASRDPKDDKFLEVAVSGGADYLVTGDTDLLVLHPFQGIPILTPADFLLEVEHEV